MVNAILLAAGDSKRMGKRNKLLLPFGGHPLIAHVAYQLKQCKLNELIIVVQQDYSEICALLEPLESNIILNNNPDKGLTESIKLGVKQFSSELPFMVCLGDMPLLTSNHYNALINHYYKTSRSGLIMRPVQMQRPGNPVIFAPLYTSDILNTTGEQGCRSVIQMHKDNFVGWHNTDIAYYFDIDTPADYQKALEYDCKIDKNNIT